MVLAILITFLSFFVRWRDRDMPRRSHSRKPNSRMACAQIEAAADPVDRAVRVFVNCRQSLAETLPVQSVGPLVWRADLLPLYLLRLSSKKKFSAPNLHLVLKRSVHEKRNAHTNAGAG